MNPVVAAGLVIWTLLSIPISILAGSSLARSQARLAARLDHPAARRPPLPEPAAA